MTPTSVKQGYRPTVAFISSILLIAGLSASPKAMAGQNVCEAEMIAAAHQYQIPLGVLYAVGLTETGRQNALYPHALNIEGMSVFPPNRSEALKDIESALNKGKKLIDIGCMQINHYYHADQFNSVNHMLEPRANVRYAARFLKQLRASHGSWTMAVARYHAGPNNDPAQKRYVCKVIENMVSSGFGKWTKNAQAFCG